MNSRVFISLTSNVHFKTVHWFKTVQCCSADLQYNHGFIFPVLWHQKQRLIRAAVIEVLKIRYISCLVFVCSNRSNFYIFLSPLPLISMVEASVGRETLGPWVCACVGSLPVCLVTSYHCSLLRSWMPRPSATAPGWSGSSYASFQGSCAPYWWDFALFQHYSESEMTPFSLTTFDPGCTLHMG